MTIGLVGQYFALIVFTVLTAFTLYLGVIGFKQFFKSSAEKDYAGAFTSLVITMLFDVVGVLGVQTIAKIATEWPR